jgi:hypothetical protein
LKNNRLVHITKSITNQAIPTTGGYSALPPFLIDKGRTHAYKLVVL